MPYKSQAELDEALRVGTVADASVEAVEGESKTAPAEGGDATDQTDGDAEGQAGDEPAASAEPEAPAKPRRKTRS